MISRSQARRSRARSPSRRMTSSIRSSRPAPSSRSMPLCKAATFSVGRRHPRVAARSPVRRARARSRPTPDCLQPRVPATRLAPGAGRRAGCRLGQALFEHHGRPFALGQSELAAKPSRSICAWRAASPARPCADRCCSRPWRAPSSRPATSRRPCSRPTTSVSPEVSLRSTSARSGGSSISAEHARSPLAGVGARSRSSAPLARRHRAAPRTPWRAPDARSPRHRAPGPASRASAPRLARPARPPLRGAGPEAAVLRRQGSPGAPRGPRSAARQ